MATNTTSPSPDIEGGKHVLFRLGNETYGLLLMELQEVIAQYEVTAIPELPEHYVGVLALRRAIIPVLSLRRRFGLPTRSRDRGTRVIILDVEPSAIGIEVDEVARVTSIDAADIEPPGDLRRERPYLRGMSNLDDGKLVIHLNGRRLLEGEDHIGPDVLREAMRAQAESTKSGRNTGEDPYNEQTGDTE